MDDPIEAAAIEAAKARDALLLYLADRIIPASRDATGWRLRARWRQASELYVETRERDKWAVGGSARESDAEPGRR